MIGRILVRGPLHNQEKQMWHDEIWAYLQIKTLAPACFERSPMPFFRSAGVGSWIFHPPTHLGVSENVVYPFVPNG